MSDGSFVLTGTVDDRAILESFRRIPVAADQAGQASGVALQRGIDGASGSANKIGDTLLKSVQTSSAQFPNVITGNLNKAATASAAPSNQIGTQLAQGVSKGAATIPTTISKSLAAATSTAGPEGTRLGTVFGASAAAKIEPSLRGSMTRGLADAPAVGTEAGKALGAGIDRGLVGASSSANEIGDTLLRSVQTSSAQFPNVITGNLNKAAQASATPSTQIGAELSQGVSKGAATFPTTISNALATASATAGPEGTRMGTIFGASASAKIEPSLRGSLIKGVEDAPKVGAAAGDALGAGMTAGLAPFNAEAAQTTAATQRMGDEFTKTGQKIQVSSTGFRYWIDEQGRARQENGRFVTSLQKTEQGLEGLDAPTQQAADGMEGLGASSNLVTGAIAGLAATLTDRMIDALGSTFAAVQQLLTGYAALEAELKLASAAAGEVGAYEKLAGTVDRVGINAAGTSLEVAQLTTELIRGGMTVDEANASLEGIVKGAEATGTSFSQMGVIVSASLQTFGLEATETARVVDVLVQGANASASSVEGMGNAFKYAAPVAKLLGISIEDLAAAVGLFANAGISAEEAGTTLRNGLSKLATTAPSTTGAMLELTGQSAQAAKTMDLLGINIFNADGTMKPFNESILLLKGAFDQLDPASQINLASNLFGGEDDGTKWLALLSQSEEEILKLTNQMANSAGATDVASKAMQSFSLTSQQLSGAMDSLGNTIGKVLATALYPFLQATNALTGAVAGLPGPIKDLGAVLLTLAAIYVTVTVAQEGWKAAMNNTDFNKTITDIKGLSDVLKNRLLVDIAATKAGFISFGASSSTALAGVQASLSAISTVSVTAGMGALGIALVGVAAAAASYAVVMQEAWKETELAKGPVEGLEKDLAKLGVQMSDTTALGGPLNRFTQDATSGFADMLQSLIPLPGLAQKVEDALGAMGEVMKFIPSFAVSQGLVNLAGSIAKTYEEAGKTQKMVEMQVALNKMSTASADATNKAIALAAEINAMPDGAVLTETQVKGLKDVQAELGVNITRWREYRANLYASAEAARVAGNKDLADELTRRAKATDTEIKFLQVQQVELAKSGQARGAAAAAAKNEALSLEEVIKQLKAREEASQIGALQAETAALQMVANGNMTVAGAAAIKQQTVISGIQEEIAYLDQQLAKATIADQASGVYAELKKQRSEKANQLARAEAEAIEAIAKAQLELNNLLAEMPIRELEADIEGYSAILNLNRMLADLDQSRYNLANATLAAQLSGAEKAGASENQLNIIKANQALNDANAARARLESLGKAQGIERQILEMTLRKKDLEAQQAVNDARVKEAQALVNLEAARVTKNQDLIRLKELELASAQVGLKLANDNLDLTRQLAPLERSSLSASQQTARNAQLGAVAQGDMQAALALSAKYGQILNPLTFSNAEFSKQWAKSTVDAAGGLKTSVDYTGDMKGDMSSASGDAASLATSTRAIGLYGVRSVDAYGGIDSSLSGAAGSADEFAGTGIDSVTATAADEAGGLRSNMSAAANEADNFYRSLAAASGLPDSRFTGGPVQAGQTYRINDGPGGRSLGQEAFLNSSGNVSLIQRAANSLWTAPSTGVVLPAGITARLQDSGVLPGGTPGRNRSPRRAVGIPSRSGGSNARLEQSITALTAKVDELTRKSWDVHVHERGNSRHRQMLNMLGQLS